MIAEKSAAARGPLGRAERPLRAHRARRRDARRLPRLPGPLSRPRRPTCRSPASRANLVARPLRGRAGRRAGGSRIWPGPCTRRRCGASVSSRGRTRRRPPPSCATSSCSRRCSTAAARPRPSRSRATRTSPRGGRSTRTSCAASCRPPRAAGTAARSAGSTGASACSESEHERMTILSALGCFRGRPEIETVLDYVLTSVPPRNRFIPVVAFAANEAAAGPALGLVRGPAGRASKQFHPMLYERVDRGRHPRGGPGADRRGAGVLRRLRATNGEGARCDPAVARAA